MQKPANASNNTLIQTDVSLQAYNTLAVPARAAYLARCTNIEQVLSSLDFAKDNALPVLVLGEGSNTLFQGLRWFDYSQPLDWN